MGDTPALLSYASGLDTVVVAARVTEGSGASIVAGEDSGITTLADLKGKRIAYTTGTNTHGLVLRAVDSAGLGEDDVEQVDVPLTDLANVLGSGEADAAVVYEVFRQGYFAQHPDAVTLIDSNDLVPAYLSTRSRAGRVRGAGPDPFRRGRRGRPARPADPSRAAVRERPAPRGGRPHRPVRPAVRRSLHQCHQHSTKEDNS